jgi:predicted lactoylglutathione lyase
VIDTEKMKALAADLRKGSAGRYKWYAMGRDETSYFMDFDWGYDADRWFSDQQKSCAAWIEQEGIHIVKKLFQTELETNAAAAADAIDTLLAALEAAAADKRDALDTLVAVLNAIGYTEEFAASHPDLKVSEGVALFLSQRQEES